MTTNICWCYIKQIMNVLHSCYGTDIFIRWKMKCSIQLGFASLNRTFNLSPHENIRTIALITIHYLYNGACIYLFYSNFAGRSLDARQLSVWRGLLFPLHFVSRGVFTPKTFDLGLTGPRREHILGRSVTRTGNHCSQIQSVTSISAREPQLSTWP